MVSTCVVCPQPTRLGLDTCSDACRMRRNYRRDIKAKLCPRCHIPNPGPYVQCNRHRLKSASYLADRRTQRTCFCGRRSGGRTVFCEAHRKAQRAAEKARYGWLKANGMCVHCRHEPSLPGHVKCRPCMVKHAHETLVRYYRLKAEKKMQAEVPCDR